MNRFLPLAIAIGLIATVSQTSADPCGMVPPIYTGPGVPIVRTGLQQTYVFYKDGVETFVIRPGFQGRVEDFGMLIPFPTPPALRKVPDNVFAQIDNAIDPPEVVVDLREFDDMELFDEDCPLPAPAMEFTEESKDSVVVLKQEAVGMYEVAVLSAGSAKALKGWMDQHKYQYPEGMDKVTEDYIQDGWCFVAVKTRVGDKQASNPRAGQRNVDTKRPDNSVFDGNVQGMGFRFRVDQLVVPMRLSAFNDGDLRNVVYLLTDSGKRIRNIPEEYVVRQITGEQVYRNVTEPLPLRIIGGTVKEIPEWRKKNLDQERNPGPHNGVAKTLFSSDLLAVTRDNLSLDMEEDEKNMLAIGEHFGLRGFDYDQDIADAQHAESEEVATQALHQLKQLTLTVIDGDFPRSVIAEQNLTFAGYQMPASRNHRRAYDASTHGPGAQREGRLISSLEPEENRSRLIAQHLAVAGQSGLTILAIGVLLFIRRRNVMVRGDQSRDIQFDDPKEQPHQQ